MNLLLAFALSSLLAGFQDDSRLPPHAREEMKKFNRGEGTLKPGDLAVDFDLKVLHSERKVALSSFRGKRPVALVFGSYT